jgi:hypothetical protein
MRSRRLGVFAACLVLANAGVAISASLAAGWRASVKNGVAGKRHARSRDACRPGTRANTRRPARSDLRSRRRRTCAKRAPAVGKRSALSVTSGRAPIPASTPAAASELAPIGVGVGPVSPIESAGAPESSPLAPETPTGATASFRFFSPSSVWNEAVGADALLDASSGEYVESLAAEVAREQRIASGPWINTTSDGVPIYTVAAGESTVPVTLEVAEPALAAAWTEVPLPAAAQPAAGTDKILVVWQPSTDRMWEFWRLLHRAGGWSASWGGAIQSVSGDPGVYGAEAWPGAMPWWGASASSLAIAGGLMTFEDLQQGRIEHALAISVPNPRATVYALPAKRTDGQSERRLALPEGAHLRLDPTLDLSALHLPRLTLMMAEAAQRYGIIVRDRSPNIAFFGQDPTSLGENPYLGASGYYRGLYPNQVLASFPWSHLQLLKMTLAQH